MKTNKAAFTVVEALVVFAIMFTVVGILLPAIEKIRQKGRPPIVEVYQCVKTYTINTKRTDGDDTWTVTNFRANLRSPKAEEIQVFRVEDETVFANLEEKEYYEVSYYKLFGDKYIKSIKRIPAIVAENGESP